MSKPGRAINRTGPLRGPRKLQITGYHPSCDFRGSGCSAAHVLKTAPCQPRRLKSQKVENIRSIRFGERKVVETLCFGRQANRQVVHRTDKQLKDKRSDRQARCLAFGVQYCSAGLALPLHRARHNDVWLQRQGDDADIQRPVAGRDRPKLDQSSEQSDEVTVELPEYVWRRRALCQDVLASIDAIRVLCCIVLARLLGTRMCERCPACNVNDSDNPCQNNFGSIIRPWVVFLGVCGGLVLFG